MPQLSDDCFAFDGPPMPAAEALRRATEKLVPVTSLERVALADAAGRILCEDVTAPHAIPPYDNSAVDGYAVYHADLDPERETVLPVIGRIAAGSPLGRPQRRGEAARIFTGAPIPEGPQGGPGPDTVMMSEDCRPSEDGARVAIAPGIKPGANYRAAGEDVAKGTIVLRAGTRLGPAEVGMLAACGRAEAPVHARLRVALFSTGDEVTEPGAPLPPGALYDSNRFAVGAALRALGCEVVDLGILEDEAAAVSAALTRAAAECDAVLSSGGMSMGEEDHVRAVLERTGRLDLWRVAIKPGRPIGLGMMTAGHDARRVPVIGLPGNPVAALTTFITLARPVLQTLMGADPKPPPRQPVLAGFDYRKKAGRREYVRARLAPRSEGGGLPVAEKHGRGGAGVLSSMVGADGFVELPEDDTHIQTGEQVEFLPFSEVFR
jgi:molybdopterin molybdotransferase